MRIVVAADKFRGTATAAAAVAAIADAASALGHSVTARPMADGGEGTLEIFGGPTTSSIVTGPLGDPVDCAWRMHRGTAVLESARACGLDLVGGAEHNDPIAASTFGVGELIDEAITRGADRVVVGLGGSATTDGGLGAISALGSPHRFRGIDVDVACDAWIPFVGAAELFGPQKGATPAQVSWLTARLEQLVERYAQSYGRNVGELPGAGAAGGLAGGLAALGATLTRGFDLVADEVGLHDDLAEADLVITGEGRLDATSFAGKVVGGVAAYAAEAGVDVAVVAGEIDRTSCPAAVATATVSLSEQFGRQRAMTDTLACLHEAVPAVLAAAGRRRA